MTREISIQSSTATTHYDKKVAIMGVGSVGRSIAICLAMHHIPTVIQARSLDRQKRAIPLPEQSLVECGEFFGWSDAERQELLSHIKAIVGNTDIVSANLVIGAPSGSLEEHRELYRDLDAVLSEETIVASITSSTNITELDNATQRPSLVAGMHFFNPVPLIDLVETVLSQHTSQETLERIQELCDAMGKETVYVEDSPGYIVNRMLILMINEAITELAQGIGSIEDIGRAMRIGASHSTGPLELADWIRLDTCPEILEGFFTGFMDSRYRPHLLLRRKVRVGQLGRGVGVGFYRYMPEEEEESQPQLRFYNSTLEVQVRILGCGSAYPTRHHPPSAQALIVAGYHYLIDADEGVQHSLIMAGYKMTQLEALFTSHAHGDHCFGLPGLLTSMIHVGRTEPLMIMATTEVADFIRYIEACHMEESSYALSVMIAPSDEVNPFIYTDEWITVGTLPLRHRTSTVGFLCREHCMPRRIDPVAMNFYQIPYSTMPALQMGLDYVPQGGGHIIPNRELTKPGRPPRSYAYLSDTLPAWHLVEQIRGVNFLCHESTYSGELLDCTETYGHLTARQAAEVAEAAEVGRLLLGHYSGRYNGVSVLLREAQKVFPSNFAAQEGDLYEV